MTQNRIQQLEKELNDLKESFSFKIGRFITFPIRKIYDFVELLLSELNEKIVENSKYKDITSRYIKKNENVIFTFIFGGYDNLKEPAIVSSSWDYICFTDNKSFKSDIWQVVYLEEKDFINYPKSDKKKAMLIMIEYYKYISKEYKIVMSIGGQIKINCDLNEVVKEVFNIEKYDLSICMHPIRNCIYEEAEECKILEKDSHSIIDIQISRYRKEKYPIHFGLYETGVIIRDNKSEKLKKVCKIWAKELKKGSQRDQLSLNYSIWKAKNGIRIFEIESNKYMDRKIDAPFSIHEHKIKYGL